MRFSCRNGPTTRRERRTSGEDCAACLPEKHADVPWPITRASCESTRLLSSVSSRMPVLVAPVSISKRAGTSLPTMAGITITPPLYASGMLSPHAGLFAVPGGRTSTRPSSKSIVTIQSLMKSMPTMPETLGEDISRGKVRSWHRTGSFVSGREPTRASGGEYKSSFARPKASCTLTEPTRGPSCARKETSKVLPLAPVSSMNR